ncbi:MAG: hypothetical protein H0X65_16695 [Gemmatimonadetes bacterium]|nr:hypothetical protein [Gemmatimonadota bacterium]
MSSRSTTEQVPQVTLYVDADQDLRHTSYVYTGLFHLAHQKRIALRVRYPSPGERQKSVRGSLLAQVEIRHSESGKAIPACFDLRDQSYIFYPSALEHCSIYFKRSYHELDVESLSEDVRSRVRPFGLTYPCSDLRSYPVLARAVARAAFRAVGRPKELLSWPYKLLDYGRLPGPADFEHSSAASKEPVIVFQPRLWEQSELVGECAATINEQRIEMVVELRRAFGERFCGGLVPTPLARERYPELVSSIHPRSYPQLARRSLIGVYTRGLHHSTAWKLGEYFAASMCVVAEPVRNELPAPLQADRHYLPFASAAGCVDACARILDDPERQQRMRVAAYEYFMQEVRPAARLLRCIEQVRQLAA